MVRARVDSNLDWHHLNMRAMANYLRGLPNIPDINRARQFDNETELLVLENAHNFIEINCLANTEFLITAGKSTIADTSADGKLIQMNMVDFEFGKYPKISK